MTSSTPTTVAVMAGGRGLRLWPRSTSGTPKQFHGFFGGPVLLRQSLALAGLLAPAGQTYVVTAAGYAEHCRALAGEQVRILAEPAGRDTAACVGLAAVYAQAEHPGAVLALLPADHWVGDRQAFARTLSGAIDVASREERLVTVGIRPLRPETGYGYIMVDDSGQEVCQGRRFREKPGHQEAERLIAGGNVFWNAGIFVAKARVILDLIGRHLPGLGTALGAISAALGTPQESEVLAAQYAGLPSISFDHGVAERLDDFLVVRADFPWDDLGSWPAFARLLPSDREGNITVGRVYASDSQRCLADVPDLRTVLLGVSDLVVVQEGDCLLIASPDRAQEVKRVAAAFDDGMEGDGGASLRAWGRERRWAETPAYAARILEVRAGASLSISGEPGRQETLYFDRGDGEMALGGVRRPIQPGNSVLLAELQSVELLARTNLRILAVAGPIVGEGRP